MSSQLTDSPTHRVHLLQMDLKQIEEHIVGVRARRNIFVEKKKKLKANTKLQREAEINTQCKKLFAKIERKISGIDEEIEEMSDLLNKSRALILELSDFEVDVNKLDESINNNGDEGDETD